MELAYIGYCQSCDSQWKCEVMDTNYIFDAHLHINVYFSPE